MSNDIIQSRRRHKLCIKKVKEFIQNKKNDERRKYEKKREKHLLELGLYEKVYSPDDKYSEEFPYSDWEGGNSDKYYKKVPVEITDEEYFELEKYSEKQEEPENNPVAVALSVIAWIIFIAGFIAGFVLGTVEVERGYYYSYNDTEFSFAIALIYWSISLISGTILLGFAEIIKLLDAIKRK